MELLGLVVRGASRGSGWRGLDVFATAGARGLGLGLVMGTAFLLCTLCRDWLAAVASNAFDLETAGFSKSLLFAARPLARGFSSASTLGGVFSFPPPSPITSIAGKFKLLASNWPKGARLGAAARLNRGFFDGIFC